MRNISLRMRLRGWVDPLGIYVKLSFSPKIKDLFHQPARREVKWLASLTLRAGARTWKSGHGVLHAAAWGQNTAVSSGLSMLSWGAVPFFFPVTWEICLLVINESVKQLQPHEDQRGEPTSSKPGNWVKDGTEKHRPSLSDRHSVFYSKKSPPKRVISELFSNFIIKIWDNRSILTYVEVLRFCVYVPKGSA